MKIRCPSCATLFSADNEAVEAGHGLVRCSLCRNVFKAAENKEEEEQAEIVQSGGGAGDRFGNLPAWIRGELLTDLKDKTGRWTHAILALQIGLVLVLCAGLIAQVAYARINYFSQINTVRPALERICQLAQCQLPPLRKLDKIELVDSQILRQKNKLINLKLSILNKADFDQSYPVVHVTMSNYLNQIVAEGRFRPGQYAPDNANLIARQTTVIDIFINDPGQRIRSYEVSFL